MSIVLVNFIQDRSGSMSSVWDETLNGFEAFVKDLIKGQEQDEYLFSLTCFDTQIDTPIVAQKIDGKLDEFVGIFRKYGPRGSTALYDATGKTIKAVEDNSHGADKIIVVICTDGHENSSREWSKDALHASIDAKIKLGNWTFTYLGTQPETWDDATALGIAPGSASTYVGTTTTQAYTTVACALNNLAKSSVKGSANMLQDFTTRSMRSAANMKTRQDDEDDKNSGIGHTPKVSIPQATPNLRRTPSKSNSSKRWK